MSAAMVRRPRQMISLNHLTASSSLTPVSSLKRGIFLYVIPNEIPSYEWLYLHSWFL
jgi:hypothetical protein